MADFELEQEIHTMSLEHLITPENKEVIKQNKTRLEKKEWGNITRNKSQLKELSLQWPKL